jgi:uncharacterized protein (TIGR02145 family)
MMKKVKTGSLILITFSLIIIFSCTSRDKVPSICPNEVKIGSNIWMTQNLNVDHFRNGDSIPEVKTDADWKSYGEIGKPAWCYYNNDPQNGQVYGKLYNWHAVADPRGLAPVGWHVASDSEWTELVINLGGIENAGYKMKTTFGWNLGGNGNNSSCFTGLPGGGRDEFGNFDNIRAAEYADFWTSTSLDSARSYKRNLYYQIYAVGRLPEGVGYGLSVRCIKD